jgi:hypothetical protein
LAYRIHKEAPETEFCGFVQTRQSMEFLRSQKDISYTSLILEADIHKKLYSEKIDYEYINLLEKEYGIPNLWPYLYIDRVVMQGQLRREYPHDKPILSHEEILKRIQVTAKEIEAFLDREKPDTIVFSVVGSVTALLLWHIAKKRGIKTLILRVTLLNNRICLTEDYNTFTWVDERVDKLERTGAVSASLTAAQNYIEEFRKAPKPYDNQLSPTFNFQAYRFTNLRFLKPQRLLWSVYWHAKTLLKDLRRGGGDYDDIYVWWQMWDKCKRKLRGIRGYESFYSAPKKDELFAFFPLHSEPEAAVLLHAPYHTNQLELVRAAAHALPIGMKLYVKEHPEMVGYRTRRYYREMTKIPNVRLIHPTKTSFEILHNALLTFTITGTAGWESLLFKKPTITFGKVFYNALSFVKKCESFETLPYLVKEQLENFRYDEAELLRYISAIIEDSTPAEYTSLWFGGGTVEEMKVDAGVVSLAHLLLSKCNATRHSQ